VQPDEWHVLLVEDEYDSIQLVSKILRYNGAKVTVAHNGYECLALVDEIKPTLIIMDLGLPKMNGWETLAKLRENPNGNHSLLFCKC
jgi:CheY-like chemotaxis protein